MNKLLEKKKDPAIKQGSITSTNQHNLLMGKLEGGVVEGLSDDLLGAVDSWRHCKQDKDSKRKEAKAFDTLRGCYSRLKDMRELLVASERYG